MNVLLAVIGGAAVILGLVFVYPANLFVRSKAASDRKMKKLASVILQKFMGQATMPSHLPSKLESAKVMDLYGVAVQEVFYDNYGSKTVSGSDISALRSDIVYGPVYREMKEGLKENFDRSYRMQLLIYAGVPIAAGVIMFVISLLI